MGPTQPELLRSNCSKAHQQQMTPAHRRRCQPRAHTHHLFMQPPFWGCCSTCKSKPRAWLLPDILQPKRKDRKPPRPVVQQRENSLPQKPFSTSNTASMHQQALEQPLSS
jgi:hypothetical protein